MAGRSVRERVHELRREIRALALAFRDPRTPWYAKVFVAVVVGYALSPIDPVPDVIPVVGYLDELVVLPVGVVLARRLVPEEVLADCRARTGDPDGGRLRWLGAALVVLGWGLAVGAVLWLLVSARPLP